jgi:hypothetical protein
MSSTDYGDGIRGDADRRVISIRIRPVGDFGCKCIIDGAFFVFFEDQVILILCFVLVDCPVLHDEFDIA